MVISVDSHLEKRRSSLTVSLAFFRSIHNTHTRAQARTYTHSQSCMCMHNHTCSQFDNQLVQSISHKREVCSECFKIIGNVFKQLIVF